MRFCDCNFVRIPVVAAHYLNLCFLFKTLALIMSVNLEQLEEEVHHRKRGVITLENVYVVLLVAAWASIVLLVCDLSFIMSGN